MRVLLKLLHWVSFKQHSVRQQGRLPDKSWAMTGFQSPAPAIATAILHHCLQGSSPEDGNNRQSAPSILLLEGVGVASPAGVGHALCQYRIDVFYLKE